jgi:hypothetical protein
MMARGDDPQGERGRGRTGNAGIREDGEKSVSRVSGGILAGTGVGIDDIVKAVLGIVAGEIVVVVQQLDACLHKQESYGKDEGRGDLAVP